MAILWGAALLVAAPLAPALAQGAKSSTVATVDVSRLKLGEFVWAPNLAPKGPMVMLIGLESQQAYVYRNGIRIGASTVSTGKKGKETPTGVFTILQKKADHRSNLYNNAPMPYMQRLTWDGIALHAGNLPGKPASHGCVRLPMAFAKALFAETSMGMTVVITDEAAPSPTRLDGGDLLAPVGAKGAPAAGAAPAERLLAHEAYRWTPDAAQAGPVTLVVSTQDSRLLVLRNGKVIGRGRARIAPGHLVGTHALEFTGFDANGRSQWIYIAVPGQEAQKGKTFDLVHAADLNLDPAFQKKVRGVLAPGATLVATDGGIFSGGAGKSVKLMESQPS
ncbi:MAG TPA: L,D-transpeptidase [Phenylobacterium sp.]|jgi:hypothetical protein